MNSAFGKAFANIPIKGILPPSAMHKCFFLQKANDDYATAFSRQVLQLGAFHPEALCHLSRVTLALQGTSFVKRSAITFLASSASNVGGSLTESLRVLFDLITFPATDTSGNPEAPVTASLGSHPLPIRALRGFSVTFLTPLVRGNCLIAACPRVSATSQSSLYLWGGMSWQSSWTSSPVFAHSSLSINCLRTLKEEGTTPEASPECTPCSRTSTVTVTESIPRRELVSQKVSQSRVPESRQKQRRGLPILLLSFSRQVAMCTLPLSSSPSVTITHLGILRPCCWQARIERNVPQVEQPSSAPPLPQSFPFLMTGMSAPMPSFHPSMGGCLSKCPQQKTVQGRSPSTSVQMMGERASSLMISDLSPLM